MSSNNGRVSRKKGGRMRAVMLASGLALLSAGTVYADMEAQVGEFVLFSYHVGNEKEISGFWAQGTKTERRSGDALEAVEIRVPPEFAAGIREAFEGATEVRSVPEWVVVIEGSNKVSRCHWEAGELVCDSN